MAQMGTEAAAAPVYVDFEPSLEWMQEEKADTVILDVPGFTRAQIKLDPVDESGKLKISGQRLVRSNRWSRFNIEIEVPKNCDSESIDTKFEEGALSIIMPKKIIPPKPTLEAQTSRESPSDPKSQDKSIPEKPRENKEVKTIENEEKAKEPVEGEKNKDVARENRTGQDDKSRSKPIPEGQIIQKPQSEPKLQMGEDKTPKKATSTSVVEDSSKPKSGEGKESTEDKEKVDQRSVRRMKEKEKDKLSANVEKIKDVATVDGTGGVQKRRNLIIGIAVGTVVVVGLGVFFFYRVKRNPEGKKDFTQKSHNQGDLKSTS